MQDDEIEIQWAYPDVVYRYLITPRKELDHRYQELSLDPELIQKLINQGMSDALEAILSRFE